MNKKNIKQTFVASNIETFSVYRQPIRSHSPKAGDVGIFRVVQAEGEYVKDVDGSNHYLFTDDLIMGVFGNRYATNQVEGYVPEGPSLRCQLLSRGGVVGQIKTINKNYKRKVIELELVAYATDVKGNILNTIEWQKLNDASRILPSQSAKVILSIGTSMDSGKTTTAAYLCAGLQRAGKRVAYVKLTGTSFPKDIDYVLNRGADIGLDFSHFGFPSTFLLDQPDLMRIHKALLNVVWQEAQAEYVVVEIADGILQRETRDLLQSKAFMDTVHATVLSCGDSLGVLAAIDRLNTWGISPRVVTGLFTASPLLVEEVRYEIDQPILGLNDLISEEVEGYFTERAYASLLERA